MHYQCGQRDCVVPTAFAGAVAVRPFTPPPVVSSLQPDLWSFMRGGGGDDDDGGGDGGETMDEYDSDHYIPASFN